MMQLHQMLLVVENGTIQDNHKKHQKFFITKFFHPYKNILRFYNLPTLQVLTHKTKNSKIFHKASQEKKRNS